MFLAQARGEKSPPAPLAMLTSFPAHPGRALHVEVFTQVSNAPTLLADLQARKLKASLIRLDRVASTFALLSAAKRALHCSKHGTMKTRAEETELLFNLSVSNSISYAFRTWGISDDTKEVVVCMWNPSEDEVRALREIVRGERIQEGEGAGGQVAAAIDAMDDAKREDLVKLYKLRPKELALMSVADCISNILSIRSFKSR